MTDLRELLERERDRAAEEYAEETDDSFEFARSWAENQIIHQAGFNHALSLLWPVVEALEKVGCNETFHRLGGIDDCYRCLALEKLRLKLITGESQGEKMEQKPSIGRIVHYQKYGTPGGEHKPEPSPAVITKVEDDGETCHLFVMNPNGCYFNKTPYSAEPKGGHWNWPPRQ